jgi:hypothetical protein
MSGCACFPGNNLQNVDKLPSLPEGTKKQTISYLCPPTNDCDKEFVDEISNSGYFESWGPGSNGDISIESRLLLTNMFPATLITAAITGASFMIIPSWATDTYNLTAKVKTKNGKEHYYKLEDTTTVVYWLPMIVVPGGPFSVPGEVRKNIWKNLLLKMNQDGVFQQQI